MAIQIGRPDEPGAKPRQSPLIVTPPPVPPHGPGKVLVPANHAATEIAETRSPSIRKAATRRPTTLVGSIPASRCFTVRSEPKRTLANPLARTQRTRTASPPAATTSPAAPPRRDHVARVELAAATLLGLAVHGHAALDQQGLGVGA